MDYFTVSSLFLILIVTNACATSISTEDSDLQENESHHRRHRHRHRHHLSSEDGNEDDSDNGDADTQATSSSLESRLRELEQDVKYLCLEDEEDLERQVRNIGVKCVCPKTEAPVCGSDNVTYYNRCYLHCRAKQAENSYHRYKITLKKFGRC